MAANLKKVKRDMSAAIPPILMKFAMMMHLSPLNLMRKEKFILKISKFKMADGSHLENRKIAITHKSCCRY